MNKIIIDDLSKRKNIRIAFKKFQWKNKKKVIDCYKRNVQSIFTSFFLFSIWFKAQLLLRDD